MQENRSARRKTCIVLLLLLTAHFSFSQNNFKVTGKVTDASGKSVPGATVKVKGTSVATATEVDGSYSLMAPSGTSILVITSVGFVEQEVAINNRSEINIAVEFSTSN